MKPLEEHLLDCAIAVVVGAQRRDGEGIPGQVDLIRRVGGQLVRIRIEELAAAPEPTFAHQNDCPFSN